MTQHLQPGRCWHNPTSLWGCVLLALCVPALASQAPAASSTSPSTLTTPAPAASAAAPSTSTPPVLPSMPVLPGTQLDRVVAIVNGDLILDSDVEQEQRFSALLPYGEAGGVFSRDRAIERLVNRDLILQQARLQPGDAISDDAVAKDLTSLQKSIPACKRVPCDTAKGWDSFLATQGFTEASLDRLWRQRMEVLAFIEQRFRMGTKISQAQIQSYYDHDLTAQFAAQHATPPPLDTISARIEEVLLQQQVSSLLGDWLRSLRAQGSVVVLHPGEEVP